MRGAILVSLVVLLSAPMTAGIPDPIIPQMTITLSPVFMNITTKENDVNATFHGTVQIDKLPLERIVVALSSSVDTGWASACSPSSMVITDKDVHPFTCTVMVPVCVTASAIVTAEGKGQGGGFVCMASASAQLDVVSKLEKQTNSTNSAKPGTSPVSSNPVEALANENGWLLPVVGIVIAGTVSAAAYGIYWRKRRRPGDG